MKDKRTRPRTPATPDPTPAEIRQRCDFIQERWTERERAKRAGREPKPWLPPEIVIDETAEASSPQVDLT